MLACPGCRSRLHRRFTDKGVVFVCPRCGGKAASLSVLRRSASRDFLIGLRSGMEAPQAAHGRRCPHCLRRMSVVGFALPDKPLVIDVCPRCHVVWFDAKEYEQVPRAGLATSIAVRPGAPPPGRPPVERAKIRPQRESERESEEEADESIIGLPKSPWDWIPGIFGLPVEYDAPRLLSKPMLTWGLSILIGAIWLLLASAGTEEEAILGWGFIPNQWYRHGGLTLLSGFLLHAGLWHLLSNVYFFLIFGDNVEDHLGKGLFALLLVASHVAGNVLHALYDPRGDMPCVGASAGIAGVMGYYAVAFPHARIGFFRLFFWFRIRAIYWLVLFVLLQFFLAWQQILGASNVSGLAHLGGLTVGVSAGLAARILSAEETPRRESAAA